VLFPRAVGAGVVERDRFASGIVRAVNDVTRWVIGVPGTLEPSLRALSGAPFHRLLPDAQAERGSTTTLSNESLAMSLDTACPNALPFSL